MKRAYFVLLHVAVIALAVIAWREHFRPDGHVQTMLEYHRWIDPHIPAGSVIFLGDSITEGLAVNAIAPNAVNYGIGGLTTQELLDALPQYRSLAKAKAIYLEIGVNDLYRKREPRFRELAASLPHVPIVWSAILPTALVDDAARLKANATIKALCTARCTFIEAPTLDGNDIQRDKIHLTASGYAKWIEAMRAQPASPALAASPVP